MKETVTMLQEVFKDIQTNKSDWLKCATGVQFEERFLNSLKTNNFNPIRVTDISKDEFKKIKNQVINKLGDSLITNPFKEIRLINCFLYQPYGSQEFPDFLVFTDKYILPIEIKYSQKSQPKPLWNGNLPKEKAIYVFGSYGKQDVTFFWGGDVLPQAERKELVEIFEEIKKAETVFEKEQKELFKTNHKLFDRGFSISIRRAFKQYKTVNKKANLNFFTHPDRNKCEENVITELSKLS